MKLRFAIPTGSLFEATKNFLREAGYSVKGLERTYRPLINDSSIDLRILRSQEIPMLVEWGSYDIGIAGSDWIRETRADVKDLLDLEYGEVKLVLAVPKNWEEITSFENLLSWRLGRGEKIRISTEYLNLATDYVKGNHFYTDRFEDSDPVVITP
nr:ATP phosphoribosyltransferase [Nitrososphaeria archaeon]